MDLSNLVKQCQEDSDRWFPSISKDLPFTVLALVGETGEMANLVKKVVRGSVSLEKIKDDLGEEAVDVLIYLCMVFSALDIDIEKVYTEKRAKNELRFGHGPLDVLIPNAPGSGHYCLSDDCNHQH